MLGSVAHVQSCVIFGAISACVPAAQGIRQIVYVYPVNMTCALIVVLFGVLAVHRFEYVYPDVYPVNIRRYRCESRDCTRYRIDLCASDRSRP